MAQWVVALEGLEMTTIDKFEFGLASSSSSTSWAVSHDVTLVAVSSARSRSCNVCSIVLYFGLAPHGGVDGRICGRFKRRRESWAHRASHAHGFMVCR